MQKSVIEYLVHTAAKHPQKTAVQDTTGSITFTELLQSAFVIADAISPMVFVAVDIVNLFHRHLSPFGRCRAMHDNLVDCSHACAPSSFSITDFSSANLVWI